RKMTETAYAISRRILTPSVPECGALDARNVPPAVMALNCRTYVQSDALRTHFGHHPPRPQHGSRSHFLQRHSWPRGALRRKGFLLLLTPDIRRNGCDLEPRRRAISPALGAAHFLCAGRG